jgi:succinate dehydrogenase hydrophobic anchor subunit
MLPLLAIAAIYFRYHQTDSETKSESPANASRNSWWDACLWLSAIAMLVIAGWTLYAGLAS